jgi:hypothetical protein
MRPKRLRHIGTAAGDLDDGCEHVAHRPAGSTVADRHPQGEQPGVAQLFDGAILQHALPLGVGVGAAQLVDDLGQPGQPVLGRARERLFGKRGAGPDRFKGHCRLLSENAE